MAPVAGRIPDADEDPGYGHIPLPRDFDGPPSGDAAEILRPARSRLPAAAAERAHLSNLYLLTLLSAVDGSLVLLAAGGHLETLGGALLVGLLVIAGAGSWLAAHRAFGRRAKSPTDWVVLLLLGLATVASTVASAWLGLALGDAVTLHVLPKAMGVVLFLVAGEVAGLHVRIARMPAPIAAIGVAGLLEVVLRWTP